MIQGESPAQAVTKPGRGVTIAYRLVRLFWLVVLVGHGVVAALWWWLMPSGFPFGDRHFWANEVAPVVLLAWVITAMVAARRHAAALFQVTLTGFPAAWLAGAVVGRLIFPISAGRLWFAAIGVAVLMGAALAAVFDRGSRPARWTSVVVVVLGGCAGACVPLSQKASSPSTRPLNALVSDVPLQDESHLAETQSLGSNVMVHGGDGSLTIRTGRLTVFVHPVLTFLSVSPDACWTLFAPRADREPQTFRLYAAGRDHERIGFAYRGHGRSTLVVERVTARQISVDASTELPNPVYSHLNSFCDVEFAGHRRLALSFSPCPELRADVKPADYPFGRPGRVAYLDAAGRFHVAEATSGEKGPFRDLGNGALSRTDPLIVTVYDEDQPRLQISWHDWAAQASTALSPTAGWGLPVNALEFSLSGDSPRSLASLFVTLAGTSVGRGWDSVGHAAGTYRNRMRIEALDEPKAIEPSAVAP